jgi:hypothetical protein
MNWKGFGRKQLWSDLKYYLRNFPGTTEEKLRKTSIGITGPLAEI